MHRNATAKQKMRMQCVFWFRLDRYCDGGWQCYQYVASCRNIIMNIVKWLNVDGVSFFVVLLAL